MTDKFKVINFEDVKNIIPKNYFTGEMFAVDMFDAKYAHVNENGIKETPAEVFWRIAYELSRFEKTEAEQKHYCEMWFSLLWTGWFRPGGSIINGIDNSSKVSLNNCTTVPLSGDSLEAINKCDYDIMKCAAFRQGIGVDVSKLRPRGAKVNNAAAKSTGIVPWVCKLVDNGKYVGQSGRIPALLISLKINHPDVEEFITAKMKQGVIENANISVQITNDFMEAVENDLDWELRFDFEEKIGYESITKTVKAKELFDLIANTAYNCLHKDESLLVNIDNKKEFKSVKELYSLFSQGKEFKVYSFNNDKLCIEEKPITFFSEKKTTQKMFKVYTNKGTILATENHPVFKYDKDTKLISVPLDSLNRGDKIVHMYNKQVDGFINSIDNVNIFSSEKYTTWNNEVEGFLDAFSWDQSVSQYKKNKKCSIKFLNENNYTGSITDLTFTNTNRKESLSFPINITKDLSKLCGLLIGDGNLHNTVLRIDCHNKEVSDIVTLVNNTRKSLNLNSKVTINVDNYSENGSMLSIYDSVLVTILRELCYIDNKKSVTNYFMFGTIANKLDFLRGWFSADGTVTKGRAILCVCNDVLSDEVVSLLNLAGIPYKMSVSLLKDKEKIIKGKNVYQQNHYNIQIDDTTKFNNKVFIYDYKNKRIKKDLIYNYAVPVDGITSRKSISKYITCKGLQKEVKLFVEKFKNNTTVDCSNILKIKEEVYDDFVYDITVKDNHNFINKNGMLLKNCSEPGIQYLDLMKKGSMVQCVANATGDKKYEIISSNACSEKPLPAFGVCNLLSINMEMFSTNKEEYKKELEFIVPHLVRFSDNVVTYELENKLSPIPEQKIMVENLREIGMGATNIHGWFLKNNIAYDSDEAITITEDFFKNYAYNVFSSSIVLGKEKGNAPAFDLVKDKKEFMNSIYFNNIVTEFFNGDYNIKNMRNMAHMSIAPAGSLSHSFPVPCVSSGIEPVIGLYYWRRTRAISNGVYTHYFVIPNRLQEYILTKIIKDSDDYRTLNSFSGSERDDDGVIGKRLVELINKYIDPGFFKFAHEIDYMQKIKLMSSVYKWVDAAISCTYNLPNTATSKDVETIYMEAYKKGIRGVSVYVDGSREGVLIFNDPITNKSKFERKVNVCNKRPESIQLNCAPKRPEVLECNIHQISMKGELWTVLVGMLYDSPFEIFCGQTEELYIPRNCKKGKIIKRGYGKYSLEIMIRKSPVEYKDLAQVLMSDDERSLTRLLSLNLRHGVPLQFIVSQLKKSNGDITTFSKAISRVLSSYIVNVDYLYKDGEKKCPGCGKSTMIFKSGCFECIECGYSKCG